MALNLDSFRRFFGSGPTEQSQAEPDTPYKRALEAVHAQLLGSALDLKEQWIADLSRPYNETGRLPDEVIHLTYDARLSQLNRALADVHTLDAGELGNSTGPAHLDAAEFREAATLASRVEQTQSREQSDIGYRQNEYFQTETSVGSDQLSSLAVLLQSQEDSIRQEWQRDLEFGHQNQRDLETYFAGKIDQHNSLIDMAVEANPKLQETLPPQINYEQIKSEIQQQLEQQEQGPAQGMEMAL